MIDIPATITALGAFVTAVGIILAAYWSYRAKERATTAAQLGKDNKDKIVELDGKLYKLGENVDGRLTALLASSVAAARAEGVSAGEQSQRDRQSDRSTTS